MTDQIIDLAMSLSDIDKDVLNYLYMTASLRDDQLLNLVGQYYGYQPESLPDIQASIEKLIQLGLLLKADEQLLDAIKSYYTQTLTSPCTRLPVLNEIDLSTIGAKLCSLMDNSCNMAYDVVSHEGETAKLVVSCDRYNKAMLDEIATLLFNTSKYEITSSKMCNSWRGRWWEDAIPVWEIVMQVRQ